MKTYKQFNITATPFNPDVLSGLLWQLDIKGISEDEDSLSIFADEESNISVIQISDILNSLKEQNLVETFSIDDTIMELKHTPQQKGKTKTSRKKATSNLSGHLADIELKLDHIIERLRDSFFQRKIHDYEEDEP